MAILISELAGLFGAEEVVAEVEEEEEEEEEEEVVVVVELLLLELSFLVNFGFFGNFIFPI